MLQEFIGGLIEQGPAEGFPSSAFLDKTAVYERLHGIIAFHAAHGFDIALGDGLAVGDDGQGFQHCLAERLLLDGLQKQLHLRRKLRADGEEHRVSRAVQLDAAVLEGEVIPQLSKRFLQFGNGEIHGMGQHIHAHRIAGNKQDGFNDGSEVFQGLFS